MSVVTKTGTVGAAGVNGSGPGIAGTGGGAGGGITAANYGNGVDTSNYAVATGGAGGVGGNGGGGAGTGGAAGNGGVGGAADAIVSFSVSSSSLVNGDPSATGGAGGDAGKPGNYNVTGAGGGGIGGAGGSATASASTTNTSASASARIQASMADAFGGAGGRSFGPGGVGGAGGIASGTTADTTTSGGTMTYVDVIQHSGNGGAGYGGASGGAGAASTLVDAVTGRTTGGLLGLQQTADGGAGGAGSGGTAGAGGAAVSSLTFDDVTANPVHASQLTGKAIANAGAGGAGTSGANGAAGGQAYASLNLTGAATVNATAAAVGGAGGQGATMGTAGPGQALLTAVGTDVTATATAHGGQGASRAGHGKAKSVTNGTSGTFTDNATTSLAAGALVTAVSANSTGTVDGKQTGKAKVVLGQTAQPFSAFGQATADASGAPAGSDTAAVLAANPNIATAFGVSPVFFAIDELGGQYAKSGGTGPETNTETVNLTVDLTKLVSEQDLVVGFYNGTALGAGFTSMTLTITADGGATPLFTQTFTTLASAETFFTNNAVDLGKLGTGPLAGSTLTLTATLSITTANSGDGFYASLIVGDPPAATGASRFSQMMAGLGGTTGGSTAFGAIATASQPMLAMSRMAALA